MVLHATGRAAGYSEYIQLVESAVFVTTESLIVHGSEPAGGLPY